MHLLVIMFLTLKLIVFRLEGTRLQNLYDANPINRAYLMKFSKTDSKLSVLIESGSRIHSTLFVHEKSNMLPSGFAAKVS